MAGTVSDLATRKDVLLALVGPARPAPAPQVLAALSDPDWQAIDAMAEQHRLRPWLHHRNRLGELPCEVPDTLAQAWRDEYKAGAIGALTAQAALLRTVGAIAERGVPVVALKGARLAFFDYREAALRPMRDIDLLVREQDLAAALDALASAGCEVPEDPQAAIARALAGDKHLDPIWLPDCQRDIELHHRIADPGLPCIDTAGIVARSAPQAIGGTRVSFPCAEDMLGHLVLHAAYNHRFDCGPLALVDIAMLLARQPVDAARFEDMARRGGWLAGARLVIALVERTMGQLDLAIGQEKVPAPVIAAAEDLLLQDFEQRAQVLLASQSAHAGILPTLLARLKKGLAERGNMARPGRESRLGWLGSRALRTVRQLGNARSRREAASGASVAHWLYEGCPRETRD